MNKEGKLPEPAGQNGPSQKEEPPLMGLANAAVIWWWGTILWIVPLYVGISGYGQWALNVSGTALIALSFGMAVQHLGKLWKSQAFSFFGSGIFVLTLAVGCHFVADFLSVPPVWATLARITALALDAVGVPMLFLGVPYLFWGSSDQAGPEETEAEAAERKAHRRRETIVAVLSVLAALLPILTTAVKAIYVFVIAQ